MIHYLFFLCFFSDLYARRIGSTNDVSLQARVFFENESSNEIVGFSLLKGGLILSDETVECLYSSYFPISGNIILNGGLLKLQKDLYLQNPVTLSNGTVDAQQYSVVLPHNEPIISLPHTPYVKGLTKLNEYSFSRRVFCVDWSYDGKYVALGLDGSSSIDELQLFELVDDALVFRASYNVGSDVRAIAWHPSSYYIATGSISGNELRIWLFNDTLSSVEEVDNDNTNDIHAVAWSPDGNYLAAARSSYSMLYVYPFSGGTLGSVVTQSYGATAQVYDLSWDSTSSYILVGLRRNRIKEIQIFSFDGTLSSDATHEVNKNVYAAQWRPNATQFAVGLSGSSEQIEMYTHSSGSIARIDSALAGETEDIFGISWHKNGKYLAVTKDTDSNGFEIEVLYYDPVDETLKIVAGYKMGLDGDAVRWSPVEDKLIATDIAGKLYLFSLEKKPLVFKNAKLICDASLRIQSDIQFEGQCSLNGKGHTIDLSSTGSILIKGNSSLTIQNALLTGISGTTIRCENDTASLRLSNIHWGQNGYSHFDKGSLAIHNKVKMAGNYIFGYHSSQPLTIETDSKLLLSNSFTFSYDPQANIKTLLQFADDTSELILKRSTLYTTTIGMQLEKGTLIVQNDSFLKSEQLLMELPFYGDNDSIFLDEGISFGDGITSDHDFHIQLMPGVSLSLEKGSLVLQNLDSTAFKMVNTVSELLIATNASLKIKEHTSFPVGKVILSDRSILGIVQGVSFDASLIPRGKVRRIRLAS